jgi:threonine dehydrogenase-like Zn-dependent dehydrogenase
MKLCATLRRRCGVTAAFVLYPSSKDPVLGIEFHLEELEMISADGRGDVRKLSRWYFEAIRRGSLSGVADLISHRVPFSEVEQGFELLEREPESVVKIVVKYD